MLYRRLTSLHTLCANWQGEESTSGGLGVEVVVAGNIRSTAKMATELAETSHELKHYVCLNSGLLEQYSHELLHVQSLASQLVQMSGMQP